MFGNLPGFSALNNYTPNIPSKDDLVSKKNFLLNQLNDLEGQLSKFEAPVQQQQPQQLQQQPVQDVSKLVADEVKKQLAGIQQQIQAVTQSPDVGILRAMGEVLPHSDQLWLRDNLSGLPTFLASEDGKGLVELLVDSYRKSIN